MRKLITIVGLIVGIFPLLASMVNNTIDEYDVKAAYIYNFTKYIEWHKEFDEEKYFTIGVYSDSPIEKSLKLIAETKQFKNKKVVIRHYEEITAIEKCHIIYIPSTVSNQKLKQVLKHSNCNRTLMITEDVGDIQFGSVINFLSIQNKIKFEINLKEINSRELEASSQLLKMATKVYQ